jgi:O-antigen/teichoic acid export membrane protein
LASRFARYGARLRSLLVKPPAGFLGNVSRQFGGTLAGSAISFVTTVYVANALGKSEFGLMALGLAYAAVVSRFMNVNLREVVVRYVAKFWTEKDLPRMVAMTKLTLLLDAAAGTLALAVLLGLAPFAKTVLIRDERAFAIIALAGCAYVFQNVADDTALGLLRVFSRFGALALTEIAAAVLKLAGAILVIHVYGGGILGVLAALACAHLFLNLSRLALALRELRVQAPRGGHAPLSLLRPYAGELRRFLGYNYARSLASLPTRDLDVGVLGLFASAGVVGVYKLARQFWIVLFQFADAALLVVYPEIAKLWTGGHFRKLAHFVKSTILIMAASGFAAYAGAFFAVPWIIGFMKPDYAAAGGIFRIMGCGILVWSPFVWTGPLLLAANRPDLMLRCSLLNNFMIAGLTFLLIWQVGATGAALVTVLNRFLFVALTLWSARNAGLLFPEEAPPEMPATDDGQAP